MEVPLGRARMKPVPVIHDRSFSAPLPTAPNLPNTFSPPTRISAQSIVPE